METAVEDVKRGDTDNEFMQSCLIPSTAGGSTDVLLGIKYANIHPVLVHQLPSGLAIYKSALASHGNKYNCLIGGPHKSFDMCFGYAGGVSRLLAQFVQGIQTYRSWGPPKLEYAPTTLEEELFAKDMNRKEGDLKEFAAVLKFDELEEVSEEVFSEEAVVPSGLQQSSLIHSGMDNCTCSEFPLCCSNLASMMGKTNDVDVSSNEKLSYLKQLWLAQEGGLSVDYRCVRCRDCWACKDADTTEKLSLREEQEDQLIKDSVRLNFSTKSIECTLPVRGSEAEFLTTNKDIAEKVLKSVNNRYCKDENSKSQILASFKKVMDKGYLKLTNQLSAEERAMFESKEVQYYIPHRPVFADSASTPCRIVMDASSRTRKRPDGTGGRCLNDFVVKGSNSNLNLIRLLLRWSVGMFAMSGDIAQFYNACKLDPQQWNLQRFLW